jgi:20S proteasome alpha/beta subunit
MTIAIGASFEGGAVVCADTKIVATDGATTNGSKVTLALTPKKMAYAIANAAEDGNAANMLASEMTSAACSAANWTDLVKRVKQTMTEWYSGFGAARPPALHFLLSHGGNEHSGIYFCEPPNTVLSVTHVMAIGQGARPIEPLLDKLFWPIPKFGVKSALLKLAYLMHRAKSEEGSACGGSTTTVIVSSDGAYTFVEEGEMQKAEEVAGRMEKFLGDIRKGLLSPEKLESQDAAIKKFTQKYLELTSEAEALQFSSLSWLERPWWKSKKERQRKTK